jgi:hypothetical protein
MGKFAEIYLFQKVDGKLLQVCDEAFITVKGVMAYIKKHPELVGGSYTLLREHKSFSVGSKEVTTTEIVVS